MLAGQAASEYALTTLRGMGRTVRREFGEGVQFLQDNPLALAAVAVAGFIVLSFLVGKLRRR